MIYIISDWKFFLHCHSNSPVRGSAVLVKATTQTSTQFPQSSAMLFNVSEIPIRWTMTLSTFCQQQKMQWPSKDCTNGECEQQSARQQVWSILGADIIRKFVQNVPEFKESFCNTAFNYKLVPAATVLGGFTLCSLVFWVKLL